MESIEMKPEVSQSTEGMRDIKHVMKFRCVLMTPAVAAHLLENNHPKNRKPKWSRVATYKSDIENGFWELTAEAVVVDEDGFLQDGQNRLYAICEADKPAPILLITGAPRRAMVAINQGLSRSVADAARVTGLDRANMNGVAGVARAMMYGTEARTSVGVFSVQEVLSFIRLHEASLNFTFECLPNTRGIAQAGVRAVIARAYYAKGKRQRIKEFCSVLLTGLMGNVAKDTAAVRLRNWLLDQFTAGMRKHHKGMRPLPSIVYGKTEAALVAFIEERKVETLRETTEEHFPLPEEK